MTHISLLVWLSDAFIHSQPRQTESLRNHENAVWTNDLLYELMVGLTGVSVGDYDPDYDLSSNNYRLDWNSARTLYGAKKIVDDPAISKPVAQSVSETACRQRSVILSAH
jgi:heptose-I-phosphate ethanolaminephosphotransferase